MIQNHEEERTGKWARRIAWALWLTTFPLIWMGGFVTTYDAGMAVPDWPNTYGYNLFLYPLESWLKTWDIFLEHSHRLIASAAGFIAIALMILLWRMDQGRLRRLGVLIFALICLQGLIGGLRVVGQEILLANIHGCVAPLFFGLVTATLVHLTPPRSDQSERPVTVRRFVGWPVLLVVAIYLQIVIGAQLRHLLPTLSPYLAFFWTIAHLILAGLIGVALTIVWWRVPVEARATRRWLGVTSVVYGIQVCLGLLTWVVNYNFPIWFFDYFMVIPYTVVKGGAAQALVTTAHTATGSLLLAAAVVVMMVSTRGPVEAERHAAK